MNDATDLDRIALERMIMRNQSILDSFSHGVSIAALVQMTGLSEDYILALIDKAGGGATVAPPAPALQPFVRDPRNGERNQAICKAYLMGTRVGEIGKSFGLSTSAIYSILNRYDAHLLERAHRGETPSAWAARNQEICELYQGGKTLEQVGERFQITRERVRQILVKAGVTERLNGFFTSRRIEYRQKQVAVAQTSEDRRQERERVWALVRDLYTEGKTYAEIAGLTQHSMAWVQMALWKTGGPSRNLSIAGKPKKRTTLAQKLEIARRYAANESVVTIAMDFDLVPAVVPGMANRLGCYRPGYGPGVNACGPIKSEPSIVASEPAA